MCARQVAYVKRAVPAKAGAAGAGAAAAAGACAASEGDGEHDANGAPSPLLSAQWYHVSDTSVRPVSEAQVLRAQAYILLYVRRRGQQQQQGV